MLVTCLSLECAVLLFNFRSAFYIKAGQFRKRESELRNRQLKSYDVPKQKAKSDLDMSGDRGSKATDLQGYYEFMMYEKFKTLKP
jgi:hypothetical protein